MTRSSRTHANKTRRYWQPSPTLEPPWNSKWKPTHGNHQPLLAQETKQLSHNLNADTRRMPICTKHKLTHNQKSRRTASEKLYSTHDRANILAIKPMHGICQTVLDTRANSLAVKATAFAKLLLTHEQNIKIQHTPTHGVCKTLLDTRSSKHSSYKSRYTASAKTALDTRAKQSDTKRLPNCANDTRVENLSYKSCHTASSKLCSTHKPTF